MTNICINDKQLERKVWNDEVVVTFKDIDLVHERPKGTAGRNFGQNKKHFIENIDFYDVTVGKCKQDEIRLAGFKNPRGGYLITESGYLMIAKSFTDDKAWDVQRLLVNSYFREKKRFSNQSQQLEIDQEYTLEKKTYKGLPVMTTRDLSYITGLDVATINYHVGYNSINKTLLEKDDLRKFKCENKNISNMVANLLIFDRKAVEDILTVVGKYKDCMEVVNNYFEVDETEEKIILKDIVHKYDTKVIQRQFYELLTTMNLKELIQMRREIEKEKQHLSNRLRDYLYKHIDIQIDLIIK